eukprot:TRINITY_DN4280_c0_g1::TRINITY_DN4280_c0_g1_i1::g.8030::m.8030 TRINITY_DN4280_c0_g1::TRINITY_DN4280_c0_g1_i1::g.8030  ORF type:complete len:218 (-),score=41.38,sp/Q9MYN5/CDKN3_PIG/39.13/1e-41,CDKN3/PF05706.7/2.3e-27,DSPc/PF00782.15/1e-10,Y_phosphatase/PF00102.22/5.9e-10,Y_phosphatase3/PF13350.1/0.96,Y_phosphatase3/PF13350.1/0.0088,PTPlike_phytase/PF14566.1/2.5e-05 TRINITY_DN4280_c0_g1_i1:73-726(-)
MKPEGEEREKKGYGLESSDEEAPFDKAPPLEISWVPQGLHGNFEGKGMIGATLLPGGKVMGVLRNLQSDIQTLKRYKVVDIVTLCTANELTQLKRPKLVDELTAAGFRVHHFPIMDGIPPTMEDTKKAVEILKECIAQNHKVVVHCKGGLGRTGAVLAGFFLTANPTMTADEAIEHVRALRGNGAIQTVKQYNFVHDFATSRSGENAPSASAPAASS